MLRVFVVRVCGVLLSTCWIATAIEPAAAQLAPLVVPATTLAPITGNLPPALNIDVLTVVPDDALGLITGHHFRDTQKLVERLLRKLEIPFDAGDDYAEFNAFLDGLKGWDEKGTHAVAFLPVPDRDEPEVVVFVPVTNYKDFARSLGADPDAVGPTEFEANPNGGGTGYMAAKANFAVLADRSDRSRALIEAVLASKKSLASANEPFRKWISDHQVAGVVTTAGIQKVIDVMLEGLTEARTNVPAEPVFASALAKLLLPKLETLLQTAREEMTHLAAAPMLDEEKGLRLSARAVFKNDGKYAAATKGLPTLPADYLNHLPEEGLFTASAYVYPQTMVDGMIDLSLEVLEAIAKAGDAPFDAAAWKPLLEKGREAAKGIEYVSAVQSFAGESMYDGVGGLYKVADSAAFMKANEAVMREMIATIRKLSDKIPEVPIEKKQVAGVEATVITINMVEIFKMFDENTFGQEEFQKMWKAMIGNDGNMLIYTGAVDATHVVYAMGEPGFKTVATNIRENKPGLAADVMVQKTAALLPNGLAMVAYVDIGGYIELIKSTMTKAMAAQPGGAAGGPNPAMFLQMIPAFPSAPPLGYSVKTTPTTLEADIVVPMELMTATRDYVKQAMALFGGALR
jgi:hypothetical protein